MKASAAYLVAMVAQLHLAGSHSSLRRCQQVRQHGYPASCVRCQSAQDDEQDAMPGSLVETPY